MSKKNLNTVDGEDFKMAEAYRRYRSRKWIAFVLLTAVSTGLLITGYIDGANWVSVIGINYTAFAGATAWERRGFDEFQYRRYERFEGYGNQ